VGSGGGESERVSTDRVSMPGAGKGLHSLG
jgi:hypothetical protein